MHSMRLVWLGLFIATLGGSSCVGREFSLKRSFSVDSNEGDALCQKKQQVVNLSDDSAFASIKNNIGKVELRKVVLTVTNPKTQDSSLATKANGKVSVAEQSGASLELGTYSDVDLTQGASKEITYDKAAATKLASLALTTPNTFVIEAEGCNDKVPAHYSFEVEVTLYAELKLF